MSESLISSFLVSDVSGSLISLKSNEWCVRIAHVAHQKWATMSDSLRSLMINEQIALFFSEALVCSFVHKN